VITVVVAAFEDDPAESDEDVDGKTANVDPEVKGVAAIPDGGGG